MTDQIPLRRIHSAARAIGASRGAVIPKGIRLDTYVSPAREQCLQWNTPPP
jgi:hypothetical protein